MPSPEQTKWGGNSQKKGALKYVYKTDLEILYGYNYAQFENKAGSVS